MTARLGACCGLEKMCVQVNFLDGRGALVLQNLRRAAVQYGGLEN